MCCAVVLGGGEGRTWSSDSACECDILGNGMGPGTSGCEVVECAGAVAKMRVVGTSVVEVLELDPGQIKLPFR